MMILRLGRTSMWLATVSSCALSLAGTTALAQPAAAPAVSTPAAASASTVVSGVVVKGKVLTMTLKAYDKAVNAFVKAHGKPGPIGQLSRWHYRVCPMTAGMTPALNAFVSERIKQVAAEVGVPDGVCNGVNILVVVTPEPDALMADVRDHHPDLLGFHYAGETRALAAFEPPMKSWYVTSSRFAASLTGAGIVASKLGEIDHDGPGVTRGECTGTHIACEKDSDFAFILVVVDARPIVGHPIGPVAEQVAMVALSRPEIRQGCGALPTIMDALDPACSAEGPITELTAYDDAYLKGLYAYRGSEALALENGAIAKSMINNTELAPSPAAADPSARSRAARSKAPDCPSTGSRIASC